MVGWHQGLDGHEFEQTLGDTDEREAWHACSPWGHKKLDRTEWLNNNNNICYRVVYSKYIRLII